MNELVSYTGWGEPLVFIRPSLKRDVLWYTNVRLSVRFTPWPIHFKFHRVIGIDGLTVCILYGEISNFHSRVMGLYSSNCRRLFFVCRTVNWEPLGQFTSNFAQLLELIVLRSVYFLVKFRFFIQELWERKSLQILYECWRRAYHALLSQLFIKRCQININKNRIHIYFFFDFTSYIALIWQIYNITFICNQCLSPPKLRVRIPLSRGVDSTYKVCQWLVAGRWFSPGIPVFSTNKTDCHNITEILLNTIALPPNITFPYSSSIGIECSEHLSVLHAFSFIFQRYW